MKRQTKRIREMTLLPYPNKLLVAFFEHVNVDSGAGESINTGRGITEAFK